MLSKAFGSFGYGRAVQTLCPGNKEITAQGFSVLGAGHITIPGLGLDRAHPQGAVSANALN
jgi:hypothetical protein